MVVVLVADEPSWLALGCFFLLKKDILLTWVPRMDGIVGTVEEG
jgi:hypothetical protein